MTQREALVIFQRALRSAGRDQAAAFKPIVIGRALFRLSLIHSLWLAATCSTQVAAD